MIAQIYVKTDGDNTSVLVSNDKGTVYFQNVLDVPELTGIQRGASFVKHQLDSDKTEIYPDKLKSDEITKDVFINYCKINAVIGDKPNESAQRQCGMNLAIHQRWSLKNVRNR